MKKLFWLFLASILLTNPVFAADQWDEASPTGLEAPGQIDNKIRVNNEALDRLNIHAKRGLGVNYATASTLTVLEGEMAIPNAAGTTVQWRATSGSTTIPWSSIDTGAEEVSTQYYLYATADTDITGMVFKISKSSSAPSGSTYYRKIASFYNNASGDIDRVISLRPDDGTDYPDTAKAWVNFNGVTGVINDQHNVSSITDNGLGNYTLNFTTAFANSNYAVLVTARQDGANINTTCGIDSASVTSTSSVTIECMSGGNGSLSDPVNVMVVIFGDRS